MVQLEIVWLRGLELGFPATILRATLETFSFARRLMLDGAISEPVKTLSAILAGGGFATDAMFITLVKPCDTLAADMPESELCLFVDDMTVHVVGGEEEVKVRLSHTIDRSIDLLEEGLGLKVSRTKTIVVASSWTLAKKLQAKLNRHGIGVRAKVKMLGVDFSCGKKVGRSAQRERVEKVTARKSRYMKLGKKAAGRIVKAGAAPAVQYGASVYGTPNTTLKAVMGVCLRGARRDEGQIHVREAGARQVQSWC